MAVRKQKDPAQETGQVPNTGHMEETPAQGDVQGASLPALTCSEDVDSAARNQVPKFCE